MTSPDGDPRVLGLAHDYLAELEAGRRPDRLAYLARLPELADALGECLDGVEMAHRLGGPAPPPALGEGTLGDFVLVREIGRGGMGVVYEAVQISLDRRVALKVLPFAAALDERQLRRFRNEAQAAAGLHHSHIVPVHAVGCERGVHFYAMQLIDGRTLAEVIREMRGGDDRPGGTTVDLRAAVPKAAPKARPGTPSARGRESYRTAARLAAQVADALEYAHQAGVVHRDVKPANLLLDDRGSIWVADFGLAHVNDAGLTRTGDFVGTLRYVSPEQASGAPIDHRADVYSLGATLYELLTLRPLFDAAERGALLDALLHAEPRPPRQIDRAIPAELETIVLKAVAKDAADRYASAAELAADLRRFLDEVPIRARRPSLAERARKWMRRHPSFVAAALLVLAFSTAVLSVAVALVGSARARAAAAFAAERERAAEAEDSKRLAEQRELAAQRSKKEADERFRLAQRAVAQLADVALEELRDRPGVDNLRKMLLEAALAYYREFIELHKGDPDAQARLGDDREQLEAILTGLIDKEAVRRAELLGNGAVLDDLKLAPDERQAFEALNARLREKRDRLFREELPRLSADQRDQRFLELAREHDAEINAALTREQVRRLRQIELQRQGAEAFRAPEVVAALKLTAAQKKGVRSALADPFAGLPHQRRKAAYDRAVALLDASQAERWRALTGEPFVEPPPRWPFDPKKMPGTKDRGKKDR